MLRRIKKEDYNRIDNTDVIADSLLKSHYPSEREDFLGTNPRFIKALNGIHYLAIDYERWLTTGAH